jgi:multiple sugar transport system substrate-binding protein
VKKQNTCYLHITRGCLFFLLLITALLAFSEPVRAEEVSLDFWNGFTGPDGRYIQRIVDDFNKEYQGKIHVNMVVMVWDDYYNKLALALRTKRGPNVGVVHYDNVYSVIHQGIVLELDEYLDEFPIEDFVSSVWQVSRSNGHQYGIPLDFHPLVLYWNKDVFSQAGLDPEKPPSNREEFLRYCEVIKQADLKGNSLQAWPFTVISTWPHFLMWQHVFFCNGGAMFNEDCTRALYGSRAGEDSLQFMWDLIHKYEYSPKNVTPIPAVDGFRRGTSAMHLDGIWMLSAFKETAGLNFGVTAAINLGSAEHKIWTGSHTMVVFKKRYSDPVKIKASIEFVKYISDHSCEWALSNMIPARYSALQSEEFNRIPYLPKIANEIDKFTFPVTHYRYTEGIQPLIGEYLNLCLINKISPTDALAEAAKESNMQLQQDPD